MCLLKHNAQPKTITHSGKTAIPNSTPSNLPHPLYRVLTGISLASKPPPKRILFGAILLRYLSREFYSDVISTRVFPTTGLTGLWCGRNLAADGVDPALNKNNPQIT